MRERRSSGADRILNRTGDVQFGKSFAADLPKIPPRARRLLGATLGAPYACCLDITRDQRQRSRRSDQIHPARPAMNSFSGRPSHPKPEGRQRSHIGSARSANARFFGRATVPSAVTSAAPGGWRVAWRRAAAVSILRAYWTASSLPAATATAESWASVQTGVSTICTGSDDALVRCHAHHCVRSFPPMAEQAGS